ncbi:alpha/beta fold hydrolase [Amycolatopsis sp. WQ 127309]|uniref:alpha/beta fold hydrolase n=1 Tax=Amycolatopsis sp. WQ 127309 TaxID=2932773 RepID=UPI001FF626C7|nr:alpha/beta hydrolase [Amycolatopsis sp. WQ 127309]UOZ05609.1 alpha/beta hydrolase [Amycolatopsis sp. WQ 127309]
MNPGRTVLAAGVSWHVVERGQGPVVVLAAGFPQSSYAWRHVLRDLADDHRVIAFDLPGQGDSSRPPDGYDTDTTSDRVHELLRVLGIGRYLYVGHDIGAWVGFAHAHRYPDELDGVALIDANIPGVSLDPVIAIGEQDWKSWHFLFNRLADLPEKLLDGRERVLLEWFFGHKTHDPAATFGDADLDEYERVLSGGKLTGLLGYYRAVLTDIEQNARHAEPIRVPVLALGGAQGSAPDLLAKVRPHAADIRGGVIADSGHYVPEEQPAALAAALRGFHAECRAAF